MQKYPIALYRTEQIRELERLALEQQPLSSFDLMRRAGHEVFQTLKKRWATAESIAVFCGAGNNAGDGYVVAELAHNAGFNVRVYAVSAPEKLRGDALTAYQQCLAAKVSIAAFQVDQVIDAAVIVDALFGIGLARQVTGCYAEAIQAINTSAAAVIAVDVPSGLQADTGHVMGCAVKADSTVTFIGLKQGLFTGQAAEYVGEIVYAALAVPESVLQSVPCAAVRLVKKPLPPRHRCAHKGHYGQVLIIGGALGFSGAARLAGEAALRVGAGLVSIATRAEHAGFMTVGRPELMCHGVETARQLALLLEKSSVVVIGPGLGQSDWAKQLFIVAAASGKPLVIDADGLNLLANAPVVKSNWILTPHTGEAARLLGCSTAQIQQDRFAAVAAIQRGYHGIAVLKGSGTLIASAHEIAVSTTGNAGMASGGMGDVLAGVIGGLLAQGLSLSEAAQQGVYCHGLAADWAAEKEGERGLLASDLMNYLRKSVN